MGLLSAIAKLFKAIIRAIINFVKKYFAIILMIVLICVAIYFAPAIAGWLTSVGAPEFLVSAFTWVGQSVTPLMSAAWEGLGNLASSAYGAFSKAEIGTKAGLLLGLSAAIAPEETAAVIAEAGGVVGTLAGAAVSGILGSSGGVIIFGVLAAWLLLRSGKKSGDTPVVVAVPSSGPAYATQET